MINYSLFSLNIFLHKRNDPRARISPSVARNSSIHRNRKISTNNDRITSAARGEKKKVLFLFFPFSRGRSDRFCDEGSAVGGEEEEGSRKGSKKGWLVLSKRGI